MQNANVSTRSDAVEAMAEPWAIVSALMGGTLAMRKAGRTYLPKHPAESDAAYEYRKSVSTLYEAFRRTVVTMASKPFAENLKLDEKTPPLLVEHCDDIDLEGRDLQAFAHAVFQTAMAFGIAHILVDYPQVENITTLAEQRQIGARPYFVAIDPRSIIGWRAERINGVQTLTQLRIMERVVEPDGEWGDQSIEQVRVLEPHQWRTYRQGERGEWLLHAQGPVSIGCIPLATIYTGRTGFMTAEPPLMGLAHLNIEHWQSASDQSNILHVARVPILFGAGFADDSLTIKAGNVGGVLNEDPAAKLSYVEHSGAAIGAGQESLDKLEERMAVMGLELLVSKPGTKTATEASIDTAESTSALAAMVRNLEDTLAQALQYAAMWEGLPEGGSVDLEGDFTKLDPLDVQSLVAAKAAGILSAQTVWAEMQKLGMVDEELTWKEEAARLAAEAAIAQAQQSAVESDSTANRTNQAQGAAEMAPQTDPSRTNQASMPDFGPLIQSIEALVGAMGKPETEQVDLAPLVAAIQAMPAPQITVNPSPVTVEAAQITVESPTINVTPAPINVEPAQITLNPPAVTVNVQRGGEVQFQTDANGDITGASLT